MGPHKPTGGREGAGQRAFVTGLHGFTGRYVAGELAEAGYAVTGTAMPGSALDERTLAVDLCDRDAVFAAVERAAPDVVVHLAAIAFVAQADAALFYRVNLLGTRNLLEALAAQRERPALVLLASSANVYGNAAVAVIDESQPPAPANDYAVSKLAMEYMARLFMDRLPITIARPFNYTGVGQEEHFLLPKIVSHFRRREQEIELGNLAIARDFSDVRMVARAYRRLLAVKPSGEVFNVCSGVAHSLDEVLSMMARIAGYSMRVRVSPAFVRSNDVLRLAGSHERLAAVIGELDPPPLERTLRWMYEA